MRRLATMLPLALILPALMLVGVNASTSAHEAGDMLRDFTLSDVAAAPAGSRTPIIFIPGIMGSRLFNTINYNEYEIWPDIWRIVSSDLDMLQLAPDGVSPASNDPAYTTVHTKPGTVGVVANIHIPLIGYDEPMYQDILNHFLQPPPSGLGYTEGVDFWAFPYDWRKDNRLAADDLDVLVDQILAQTGQDQVYIIAHSMGGLVSRQYISDPARAAKVKRLITLGTPYLGTPKAYFVLLEGDCLLDAQVMCLPTRQETRKIVTNMPGFYELFASRAYFDVKGSGYYSVDKSDPSAPCPQCLSYSQTYTTAVASNLNMAILSSSDEFHQAIDTMGDWANPWNNVPVDIVAGVGQQTLVGIREQTKWPCGCLTCICRHAPIYRAQGDGTVALYSASMANPSNGVNLRGTASYVTFVGDHTGLTQMPAVWNYIDQRLGLATTASPAVQSAVDTTPAEFTGAQIIAFGAAAIQTYDAAGRYTGPLTDTELTVHAIPGSAYHHSAGVASVALLGGQAYTITVIPSGNSLVDLTLLQTTVNGTITTMLHTGLSVTVQSRIHLFGDPYQADTWHMDIDGDGDIDQVHAPTLAYAPSETQDTLAPTTTINIQGALGPQGWYTAPATVTITSADGVDGSGVSRVEYMFVGDVRPRLYVGPFVADPAQVSVMYVAATDRAGNMHEPIQVRIGPERTWLPVVFK